MIFERWPRVGTRWRTSIFIYNSGAILLVDERWLYSKLVFRCDIFNIVLITTRTSLKGYIAITTCTLGNALDRIECGLMIWLYNGTNECSMAEFQITSSINYFTDVEMVIGYVYWLLLMNHITRLVRYAFPVQWSRTLPFCCTLSIRTIFGRRRTGKGYFVIEVCFV